MVIIENETRRSDPPDVMGDAGNEDEHDGWTPVRPRRSSMPAAMLAEPANQNHEAIEMNEVKDPSPDASS